MKMSRIVSVILCIICIFALFSCQKEEDLGISFVKDKCKEGQITVEISEEGTGSSIYYGDENGAILPKFSSIAKECEAGTIENIVLPANAKTLVLQKHDYAKIVPIPSEYIIDDVKGITFGALSDVHYNRYDTSGGDDATLYFEKALDYLDTLNIDLVGISGDITTNGERRSLVSYNEAIKDRNYPVLTVSGNHDVVSLGTGLWQKIMNQNVEGCVFAENNLDFIYDNDKNQEGVFVFLNQVRWDYYKEGATLLNEEQLVWLENVLKEYKDETVYLFFHSLLCGDDGEKHTGVGNIKNEHGVTYDIPYTYGASDEVVFRRLLQEYKNVVFFSGHSHWMFEMECYNEKANYSNFDGKYCHMVHVPSVTSPRYVGKDDTSRSSRNGEYSQGWLVEDYQGYIILTPIDFISDTYYTEYMEIIYK